MNVLQKILAGLCLLALLVLLPACNTVKGVGQDIHDGAESTQDFFGGKRARSEW